MDATNHGAPTIPPRLTKPDRPAAAAFVSPAVAVSNHAVPLAVRSIASPPSSKPAASPLQGEIAWHLLSEQSCISHVDG
ncbi:hypothetical protein GUJ93_ZPchr0002g26633 [Zizania palustris]|uniref:Uncharacterized protein n=1 Tax=Zizania palustris TaxID=103762 RepID=A0A8J5V9X6_ZIZPA|nr:hypothetical protein GUJ93_ZPchr0002g26633 [Zizania palustris]